ncbi:Calx-beta domain-containing protein [Actinocrispum sp. NPDC049592]|uniref:Calx-beta domain-containing protein n=1 Tax=Actinocrispum sp. NPDC049592 TaxID=3154835 RepID=UPI003437AAC7
MRTATARLFAAVALLVGMVAAVLPSSAAAACTPAIVDIGGVSQPEGTGNATTFRFPVTITPAEGCKAEGTVRYHTRDGSKADKDPARAGEDYAATEGELKWGGEPTTQYISVKINPDRVPERLEVFWVQLDSPKGVWLGHGAAPGWIRNDDGPLGRANAGGECPGGPQCAGTSQDSGICWVINKSVTADFFFSSPDGDKSVTVSTVEDSAGVDPGYLPIKDKVISARDGETRASVRILLTRNEPMTIHLVYDKLTPGYTAGNMDTTITVVPQ